HSSEFCPSKFRIVVACTVGRIAFCKAVSIPMDPAGAGGTCGKGSISSEPLLGIEVNAANSLNRRDTACRVSEITCGLRTTFSPNAVIANNSNSIVQTHSAVRKRSMMTSSHSLQNPWFLRSAEGMIGETSPFHQLLAPKGPKVPAA